MVGQAAGNTWAGEHDQAGRQAASREDAVGGCPGRGVASLQLPPAGAWVCGLELGVHHTESWPA